MDVINVSKKNKKEWKSGLPNPNYIEEPISQAELKYLKDKAAEKDSPT